VTSYRFFAWVTTVLGGLLALVTGSATLMFGGVAMKRYIASGGGEGGEILLMTLILGGIPCAVGLLFFRLGCSMLRKSPRPAAPSRER
jgi:hypothetical protein